MIYPLPDFSAVPCRPQGSCCGWYPPHTGAHFGIIPCRLKKEKLRLRAISHLTNFQCVSGAGVVPGLGPLSHLT